MSGETNLMKLPQITPVGHSLSVFLSVSYLACIVLGLLAPGKARMYEAWAPLLPGFEWLTVPGFLFGLVGSYLYGWYTALIFVPLYRVFSRRFWSS